MKLVQSNVIDLLQFASCHKHSIGVLAAKGDTISF